jgi:hypothetical protein
MQLSWSPFPLFAPPSSKPAFRQAATISWHGCPDARCGTDAVPATPKTARQAASRKVFPGAGARPTIVASLERMTVFLLLFEGQSGCGFCDDPARPALPTSFRRHGQYAGGHRELRPIFHYKRTSPISRQCPLASTATHNPDGEPAVVLSCPDSLHLRAPGSATPGEIESVPPVGSSPQENIECSRLRDVEPKRDDASRVPDSSRGAGSLSGRRSARRWNLYIALVQTL